MREDGRCSAAAWRWDVSRRVQSSAKGMGVRRRASIPSVWSRSGQVWAQPGLSYPGIRDAQEALLRGEIDRATFLAVDKAHREGRRPPWGSPLGGEIYIHEGGSHCDWTQGCIALDASDMDRLFPLRDRLEAVEILPLDKLHSNGASAILRVAAQGAVQTANHPCQEVWRDADPQP